MELFSDEVIADLLDDDLSTASFDGKTWSNPHHHGGHAAGHFIKWHTIKDQESSVAQDVRRIREHPLVPKAIPIYGYVYDVRYRTSRRSEGGDGGGQGGSPECPSGAPARHDLRGALRIAAWASPRPASSAWRSFATGMTRPASGKRWRVTQEPAATAMVQPCSISASNGVGDRPARPAQ